MGVYIGERTQSYAAMQGPCDSGFHVPTNTERQAIHDAGKALGAWTDSNGTGYKTYLKMPYSGMRVRGNGTVSGQGNSGTYRSSVSLGNTSAYIYTLYYYGSIAGLSNTVSCAGASIRPLKDAPSVPNGSRTVLKQGTGYAGIYHNSTLGLISISSDGSMRYTIADKNLGATTVYNDGDALSESNCGGYFQWGNNYMFPYTGTITKSSAKVDASGYGPGNYYSSSTFITQSSNSRWDSSYPYNDNLWGGETGIVNVAQELYAAYIGEWYISP